MEPVKAQCSYTHSNGHACPKLVFRSRCWEHLQSRTYRPCLGCGVTWTKAQRGNALVCCGSKRVGAYVKEARAKKRLALAMNAYCAELIESIED